MILQKIARRSVGAGINLVSLIAPKAGGDLALRIFATPPKPKIREKEAAFLATAKQHDFTFEGKKIAVYEWIGDFIDPVSATKTAERPLVFLAYGWAYNAGRWRHYVPQLVAAGYRVIAFDPPGHGYSEKGLVTYPTMVNLQLALIHHFGRPELFLGHSFGGGCFIGALAELPPALHPKRVCLMGIFSEARWIFHSYRQAIGMNRRSYLELVRSILRKTGRRLSSFDNALYAAKLGHIPCLLVHDPGDQTTTFSNAVRNHAYWPGSILYRAKGAGHHLGTAAVTNNILAWLLQGTPPLEGEQSTGLIDAQHELRRYFVSIEQDLVHGKVGSSAFFG